ncbi:uncharacterized protein I206_105433 [Kwoniella pini CBS 10737]|uniref:Cytoplasmic protein n=1 Tax=Kwoniella pini CBS 10737 TaxID=1296096 RepID=A0A1B9I494_9TREE|nr:uncharacterized protein I206_03661 [Kwoniella pini CBS 10737]OCF50342.1 hypothetical protein I206_03661 [Kwoniella pini CBS 10737]
MMMMTKKRRTLPVTTFLTSTILLSVILPSLANASISNAPPQALSSRHEDDDSGEDIHMHMDMVNDQVGNLNDQGKIEHTHSTEIVATTTSAYINDEIISTSSASAVLPTSHSHNHISSSVKPPSGHDHGSHAAAKTILDDEGIHVWHHFPPTYLDVDFKLDNDSAIFGEEFDETWNVDELESHKGLMALHVILFYGAYFGLLPISLALRAADHPSHYIANAIFLIVAVSGWLIGKAYKAAQEDRYEGSVHESFSNVLVLLSICLTVVDSIEIIKRGIAYCKKSHKKSWSTFVHEVLSSEYKRDVNWPTNRYEMIGLVDGEQDHENQVVFALGEDEDEERSNHGEYIDEVENLPNYNDRNGNKPRRPSLLIRQWTPPSRNSTGSEGTLHDSPETSSSNNSFIHKSIHNKIGAYDAHDHDHENEIHQDSEHVQPIWSRQKSKGLKRASEIILTWIRRSQVVFAYVVFLTEFIEYTGMCRAGLINSCAAHYIKGSIFFWYGVLTFARYLGAYADLGWAWNKRPGGVGISAEMVECAVIFTYGITNTWMERFGSSPGDPYTVKQVQHISIAVMFWFAGLSGMLLESRWVRKVMGSFISGGRKDVHEPPTYAFSFNPLPALVIGVTGLAMAAHHQEYVFQVQIHSLWGKLLAGGSLFRFLTYFFLFLKPPIESNLPFRPPTEILTSFGYTSGGIVFMLSNEEISWSAIRSGWDDMMAFLNFTIGLNCFIFCWILILMTLKGWAGLRMIRNKNNNLDIV